jgi:hypothetical protein
MELRDKHSLRMFFDRVLTVVIGPRKYELIEAGENCIMRSYNKCD